MARSVQDIKASMAEAYMRTEAVRERYQLKAGDTFISRFSVSSIESILFFVVASAHHVLERLFDRFALEVEEQIERSVVATIPWYHRQALAYQHGDSLALDEATLQWRYPVVSQERQIVRYASVKDRGGSIQVLVAKEAGGLPAPLSSDELRAFSAYMASIKIAGVVLSVRSLPADTLRIEATIQLDPRVYLPSGERIRDGARPVEEAIRAYLKGITYGGVFNKTRLVDALQAVEGVVDITLGACSASPAEGTPRLIEGNNYSARSGCFIAPDLTSTLKYTY